MYKKMCPFIIFLRYKTPVISHGCVGSVMVSDSGRDIGELI